MELVDIERSELDTADIGLYRIVGEDVPARDVYDIVNDRFVRNVVPVMVASVSEPRQEMPRGVDSCYTRSDGKWVIIAAEPPKETV